MKVHFTKKKAVLIICIVLLLVIAAVPAGYFGYGATLLNPNSDRSIIASVSKARHGNTVGLGDSAVEILAKKQYGDYFAVLYQAVPPGQEEGIVYFTAYKKHKSYENRYVPKGGVGGASPGAWETAGAYPLVEADAPSDHIACFFANAASDETVCSVFEYDPFRSPQPYVRKLEEFAPPQNAPYILVREYDLSKAGNAVTCFDGSLSFTDLTGEAG